MSYNVLQTNSSSYSNEKNIRMDVVSDDGSISFTSENNKRSLIPQNDSSDFVYYLMYKDFYGGDNWLVDRNVEFNPVTSTSGTITKAFPPSYYAFYLYALTQQKALQLEESGSQFNESTFSVYATYKAYTFIDITNSDTIVFHLKPNDYSSGRGNFSLNISHLNHWSIPYTEAVKYIVTVGIYDIDKDNLVFPTNGYPIELYNYYSPSSFALSGYEFTDEGSGILSGNYNLVLKYERYNSYNQKVTEYEYSDRISILMNQSTHGDVSIPNFLDTLPEAPACFIAAYTEPNNSNDYVEKGYYTVQFSWKDKSKNEQRFKLELMEVTGDSIAPLPTSDSEWNVLSSYYPGHTDTFSGLSIRDSIYYNRSELSLSNGTISSITNNEKGSLLKNSESLILNIPLGKKYFARLCATNSAGDSNWTYLVLPNLDSTNSYEDDNGNSITFDPAYKSFGSDATAVNLYEINYVLNGGQMNAEDSDGASLQTPALTVYETQHRTSSSIKLLIPDNSLNEYIDNSGQLVSDAFLVLQSSDGRDWNYWTADGFNESRKYGSSSNGLSPYYNDYKNITLFANYIGEDSVSAEEYALYELKPEHISLNFMKNGLWTYSLNSDGYLFTDYDNDSYFTAADLKLNGAAGKISNYIKISRENVDCLSVGINSFTRIPETDTFYQIFSSVLLTVTRIKDSTILMNEQECNSSHTWDIIDFSSCPSGLYSLSFVAYHDTYPNHSYGYLILIELE